jgi:hypothetical protein
MIVILSIVVTNLVRLPLFEGSRATKRKRTRKRKTTGWRTTSPTAVKGLTEDISRLLKILIKRKSVKGVDETEAVKKDLNEIKVSTGIRHSKEFVEESGKSQNPRERRENHRENN